MFLFLKFALSTIIVDKGYQEIIINKYGEIIQLPEPKNSYFFIFDLPDDRSISVVIQDTNGNTNSIPNFKSSGLFIEGDRVNISQPNNPTDFIVRVWSIPKDICGRSGVLYYTHDAIHFQIGIDLPVNIPFCLFGLPANSTTIYANAIPADTQVYIYDESIIVKDSSYPCTASCAYTSNKNFFVNVIPPTQGHAELDYTFIGGMRQLSDLSCSAAFSPYALPTEKGLHYALAGTDPKDFVCGPKAQNSNSALIFVIVGIAIFGVIVAIVLTFLVSRSVVKLKDDEGFLIEKLDDDSMEKMKLELEDLPSRTRQPVNIADIPKFVE